MNRSNLKTTYFKLFIIALSGVTIIPLIYSYLYEDIFIQEQSSFKAEILTHEEFIEKQLQYVQIENQHAKEILSKCGIDDFCLLEALQNMRQKETRETIFGTIDEILSAYLEIGYYCHRQGHHIGEFVYGYIGNVTLALESTNIKCGGSVYHGIIENYFLTEVFLGKSPEEIKIQHICGVLGNYTSSLKRTDCAHGLGHGITKAYALDIFSSVKRCNELETATEHQACNQGVFMENAGEYFYENGGTFDKDDLLFPCNKMDEEDAPDCYLFHSTIILKEKDFSVPDAFIECDKITKSDSLKYCYMGIGRQMLASHFGDMKGLALECTKGDPLYQPWCIQGAVVTIAEMSPEQAFEFCEVAPDDFKMSCYESLGNFIQRLMPTNEERKQACMRLESSEYHEICLQRALQEVAPKYIVTFWS